ncbi:bestrophin family protein [Herbaspirillum sp. LeCh32-8]|uniref:bestrophin family protein n=1 Tax=Herbaspirillum sp. LeCh32-8 TaxID=2821356 RepID=UPI001AEB0B08|nr:bestrophin family protein [Herbaspirillum sp. LeCh32-8]MBP0597439.1 bestrophin family protein [Herbaspirillum sp. LeCh32-8]
MIVRPQPNWFRMLFVWNGSVLPSILPQMALMTAFSTLAVFTGGKIFGDKLPLNTSTFTLLGVALAIFLAFRNTASYDRFWEGRKIWGALLISARALVSQGQQYSREDGRFERKLFARRVVMLTCALKHQLRQSAPDHDLARLLPPEEAGRLRHAQYLPVQLMHELRAMLAQAHREGELSDAALWACDGQLNELNHCVGASERIASTPIPFPYGVLLHRTVYIYCLLLPFGLVDAIGYATPLISVFVSYTFLALEAIAGEIAEPFGEAANSLPLDAMCLEIERSIMEIVGEEKPEPARCGKDFRLS